MIDFLNMYWRQIVFCVIGLLVIIYGCMTGKCIEWLKGAVVEAERWLGSKTGELKLRMVYDEFIDKFPGFSTIVPFILFQYWVKIALKWFEDQLKNNPSIQLYVNGEHR